MKKVRAFRQGDVVMERAEDLPGDWSENAIRQRLTVVPHLVLAEGEVTGHFHRVTVGEAELFIDEARKDLMALIVKSETATVTHEEHRPITLPKGIYVIRKQREYDPLKDRMVMD